MGRWFDFMNLRETDSAIMTLMSFFRHRTSLLNEDSIILIFSCICQCINTKHASLIPILPGSPCCLAANWHSLDLLIKWMTLIYLYEWHKYLNKDLLLSKLPSPWLVANWRVNHYSHFNFFLMTTYALMRIKLNEYNFFPRVFKS